MNWTAWFMAALGVLQVFGIVGFMFQRQWLVAGVWTCYAAAQIFWTLIALKGVT